MQTSILPDNPQTTESLMDISIVICTHNRAELLGKVLDVLSRAVFPSNLAIEILVIANACQDATPQILEQRATLFCNLGKPALRWLEEPMPGKSMALNLAIRESQAETLCFIDDDQYVDAEFVQALATSLACHPEYEMFCGWMMPDWDGSEPKWVYELGQYYIGIRPFPEYDLGSQPLEILPSNKLPSGGNITVRRSVFFRVGGFSTDLGPHGHNLMGGEDIDFVTRALHAGARILYDPAIRQKHAVEADRMGTLYMMRKSYLRSLSNVMMNTDLPRGVRPYMGWKVVQYFILAILSIRNTRRFYYLIRLAAAFGELRGALN